MSNSQSSLYSAESIQKMVENIESFIDKSAEIINKYQDRPTPSSQAVSEMNTFEKKELVEDVYSRAYLCFENSADHLMAFTAALKPPVKTLSPYTCVRSLLESCAIALWLLDYKIDVKERVGRCFGYRYKEFDEQLKFFNSIKGESKQVQQAIISVRQRMIEVEAKAISLGYPQLTSKSGKIAGIARHMPGTVELIKMTLDKESDYRLLSGIAHSYLWVTRQFGFQVHELTDDVGKKFYALTKYANPQAIILGINLAVPAITKVLWVTGKLYGWDMQEIEGLLNQTFDDLPINDNDRFWCQS